MEVRADAAVVDLEAVAVVRLHFFVVRLILGELALGDARDVGTMRIEAGLGVISSNSGVLRDSRSTTNELFLGRGGFQQRDMGPPAQILGMYIIMFYPESHN